MKELITSKQFMSNTTSITIAVILLIVSGLLFYQNRVLLIQIEELSTQAAIQGGEDSAGVKQFMKDFISIVLKSSGGEVSLDDRLKLENDVRQLQDQDVFDAWSRFTESIDEIDAQENVIELLDILASKV